MLILYHFSLQFSRFLLILQSLTCGSVNDAFICEIICCYVKYVSNLVNAAKDNWIYRQQLSNKAVALSTLFSLFFKMSCSHAFI